MEQTRTGPSRRHIYGSEIAKGLQSVKVFSSTVPEKPQKLDRIGALKGGPFRTSIVAKHKKLKGNPLVNFFSRKSLTKP